MGGSGNDIVVEAKNSWAFGPAAALVLIGQSRRNFKLTRWLNLVCTLAFQTTQEQRIA